MSSWSHLLQLSSTARDAADSLRQFALLGFCRESSASQTNCIPQAQLSGQSQLVELLPVRRQTFWDHLTLFLRDTFLLAASPV